MYKIIFFIIFSFSLFGVNGQRFQGKLIVLKNQYDASKENLKDIPIKQRPGFLKKKLIEFAKNDQTELVASIDKYIKQSKNNAIEYKSFWIVNAIYLEAPDELYLEMEQDEIADIINENDFKIKTVEPINLIEIPERKTGLGFAEPGLLAINAHKLWKMGYTGRGTMLYLFDTGVNPNHPAVKDRFMGNRYPVEQSWFGVDSPQPKDKVGTHGTHVVGTSLGLNTATADTIGVAPSAYFIATDPIVTDIADIKPMIEYMNCYEFAFDPDNNPGTTYDIPDVINNSWGMDSTNTIWCNSFVNQVLINVHAAGIANVFSAGNEGPGPSTIGQPQFVSVDTLNSFTVGAVDGNNATFPIANFSSRGPSICSGLSGNLLIKPEVCAPGVNVRSAINENQYGIYSGTSMAAPHVSGAVLLLKEAFPNVSSIEILNALYQSAIDLGVSGEDNVFGKGMINCESAFQFLSQTYTPTPPVSTDFDVDVEGVNLKHFVSCDSISSMPVILKNKGIISNISGKLKVKYLSGHLDSLSINLSISAGQSQIIQIPLSHKIGKGRHGVEVYFEKANDTIAEFDEINNYKYQEIFVLGNNSLSDFNSLNSLDNDELYITNPDKSTTFELFENQTTNEKYIVMPFSRYNPRANQIDYLQTQRTNNNFFVSYAYNWRGLDSFSDTLYIYGIKENCTDTVLFYKKGGNDLKTVVKNIANYVPEPNEWGIIDLSRPSSDTEKYSFLFKTLNRRGGNLYFRSFNTHLNYKEIKSQSGINVYPNPFKNFIQVNNLHSNNYNYEIFDLEGRKIISGNMHHAQGTIETQNLPGGMYILRISDELNARSFKIVK